MDGKCQCCGSAENLLCDNHAEERYADETADLEKRLAEAERENRRLRGERDGAIQCLKDERMANAISDYAGTPGWPALEVSCLKCDAVTERAEKAEARLKTLCFHVHDDPARAENRRLRGELQYVDLHGCSTGDCPHDKASECVTALIEELQRIAALAETKPSEGDLKPLEEK